MFSLIKPIADWFKSDVEVDTKLSEAKVVCNQDLQITVDKKEYSIVGDAIYTKSSKDVPQWMADLVDETVKLAWENSTDLSGFLDSLRDTLDQIEVTNNAYDSRITVVETSTGNLVQSYETLNSTVQNNQADIINIQQTYATEDYAVAAAVGQIQASIDDGAIGSEITRIDTAIATEQSTRSTAITALESQLEDEETGLLATASAVGTLDTRVTAVEAAASDITALEAELYNGGNTWSSADSVLENLVTTRIDNGITNVESKFLYSSILTINDVVYNSGFGLESNVQAGEDGTITNPYSSVFKVENATIRSYDIDGNYSELSSGDLKFYKAGEDEAYKYLKFVQSGRVANGALVTLTSFNRIPSIIVSTADLMVYNKDFASQSQVLKTYPDEITVLSNGNVSFRPTAKLVVAGTSNIVSLNLAYSSSSMITTSVQSTPPNTERIEVDATINSTRSTGASGSWYKRTSNLQMQLYNGSVWYNVGSAVTVSHTDLTQNNVVVSSGAITPSTHTYRIVATFLDTGGTFTAPVDWVYFTETVADYSTIRLRHHVWPGGQSTDTRSVSLSYSLKTGEELLNSSYSVEMALISQSWNSSSFRYQARGRGATYYLPQAETVYFRSQAGLQKDLLGLAGSGFKSFFYDGLNSLTETTQVLSELFTSLNGNHASLTVDVRNRVLTLNLRKPTPLSTTATNTLSASTATYGLSEEELLATGFVNYIAIQ